MFDPDSLEFSGEENEIAEGTAIVRDLERGEQETVALEAVPGYVAGLINSDQQP